MGRFFFILAASFVKVHEAIQSVWGVLIVVLGFVANFFGGYVMILSGVIACVLIDLIWGIRSAHKQKKYTQSELMKSTVSKLTAYGTALMVFIFIEKMVGLETNIPTAAVASVICLTELWSTSGNILIVNPNIPFFKLLKPVLKGEIARKLNISEEEVDEALETHIESK